MSESEMDKPTNPPPQALEQELDRLIGLGTTKRRHYAALKRAMHELEERVAALRRRSEELALMELRYRALFDYIRSPVAVYRAVDDGKDFIIVDFNRAAERTEKVQREHIIGRSVREVFPGVEDFGLFEVFQRVYRTGKPELYGAGFYQDGRIAGWRENYVYKLPTGEVVAAYEDLTQRKEAEHAWREAEQRLRLITEQAPITIWSTDRDLRVTYHTEPLSPEMRRLAAADRILGRTLYEIADELYDRNWETISAARRALAGETVQYEHRASDGRILFSTVAPLRDEAGRITGVVGVAIDITERIETQRALTASEHRLRLIAKHALINVWTTDRDLRITYHSGPITEEMRQIQETKGLLGRTLYEIHAELYGPDVRSPGLDASLRALAGETVQYERRTPDDHYIINTVSPLYDDSGHIVGTIGIGIDVTERRRLEEQLQQAQRLEAVGQLAAGIAHDFNSILTAILGNANLARLTAPASIQPLLAEIERGARRAAQLTKQLLAFARKSAIYMSPVDVNALVREAVAFLRETIDRRIEISVQLAEGLPLIQADPTQLHQVLVNLILNARDALLPLLEEAHPRETAGRPLLISIKTDFVHVEQVPPHSLLNAAPGDYVRITVHDTGIGMDKAVQEHIFEPFFTTKGPGKGTGLGLAIVYGIIAQHKGWINVYSEPGTGTAFRIYLPAAPAKAPAGAPAPAVTEERPTGSETILVVDDEDSIRSLLTRSLPAYGYRILTAQDGLEALEIYRRQGSEIDLVLLDLSMPGVSGREVLAQLLEMAPQARVLIASGYAAGSQAVQGLLEAGARGYITKPYQLDELLRAIRQTLDTGWFPLSPNGSRASESEAQARE
ncbi:MAG: PAS domain-containing hybrid sensor histidine kinase/response regulator [Anaerolineae bacterium]